MSINLPASVLPGPVDGTLEKNRSAGERPEAHPTEEVSRHTTSEKSSRPSAQGSKKPPKRKDHGHLHATRHGVLSRYPLETLQGLGEDVKKFRRLERQFREALQPSGEIGLMLFDRFFSSYLRCVSVARAEASVFAQRASSDDPPAVPPLLHERIVPTLVVPRPEDALIGETLPPDLFRELVLIQRYDRHFSREMYRALSFLLVMQASGEDGLQRCVEQILGASKQ